MCEFDEIALGTASHVVVLNNDEFLVGFGNMSDGISKYNVHTNKLTPFIKYQEPSMPFEDRYLAIDEMEMFVMRMESTRYNDLYPEATFDINSMTINYVSNDLYVHIFGVKKEFNGWGRDCIESLLSYLLKIDLDNVNSFKLIKIDTYDDTGGSHILINNQHHIIGMKKHEMLQFDDTFKNYTSKTMFTFQKKLFSCYRIDGAGLVYLPKNDILLQFGGPSDLCSFSDIWICFNARQRIENSDNINKNNNNNDNK